MNKNLTLERVLHRRESLNLCDLFIGDLKTTKSKLKELISNYESEAKEFDRDIVFETHYDYESTDVYANVYRWETMKEYNKRKEDEAARQERARKAAETKKAKALARAMMTEADERALYETLRKKFEV